MMTTLKMHESKYLGEYIWINYVLPAFCLSFKYTNSLPLCPCMLIVFLADSNPTWLLRRSVWKNGKSVKVMSCNLNKELLAESHIGNMSLHIKSWDFQIRKKSDFFERFQGIALLQNADARVLPGRHRRAQPD